MLDEIKKSLESKRVNGNRYNQMSSMQVWNSQRVTI